TLCGAGIVYSAKINGEPTTFGTSGLLYRSNKVMYDRATRSLWSQLLGEPVIGPLANSGIKLDFFPVNLTTWGEWLAEHPDTTILSLDTGYYPPELYEPEYDANSIYFEYRNSSRTMFPVSERDDRLNIKDQVITLSIGDVHKAYAIKTLQQERIVNDTVNGVNVVVLSGSNRSLGAAIYARGEKTFGLPDDYDPADPTLGLPESLIDSDGQEWRLTDDALVNAADPSQTLPRMPSHQAYWFGWFAFHPDTQLYGVDGG
ncbi:MAG: DUF3179 domain-containing protein, partial [Chloroflexi bacterium]|nr:DUF3179 domain-containing protein [Chloroflexota bacterium]